MEKRFRSNKTAIQRSQAIYVVLVAMATVIIGASLLKGLRHGQSWGIGDTVTILLAIAVDLFCFDTALSNGTYLVRWLTRASDVYPGGFSDIRDAAENIALASGMRVPELLFIDSDFRNAFSLQQSGKATVFFSHGLVKTLNKEELQAVMAHEMAHIRNGDADLNAALVSLRGFSHADRQLRARVNVETRWGDVFAVFLPRISVVTMAGAVVALSILAILSIGQGRAVSGLIRAPLAIAVLLAANFVCAAIGGRILQAFTDPAREFVADEMAVHWTFSPDSLVSAIRRAEEDSENLRLRLLRNMGFVRSDRHDTMPSAEERIAELGSELHMLFET